jgi:hypothetical protein
MSGSSILASVWLVEGEVWDVDAGKPRKVVKVAGRDDLIDGRQLIKDGEILAVGIRSSGVFDFSQCTFPVPRVGGGYTLYLVAKSASRGPNDPLGAGNSAVSGGATDI